MPRSPSRRTAATSRHGAALAPAMAAPGANGGAGNARRDDGHVAGEERRRLAGLSHAAGAGHEVRAVHGRPAARQRRERGPVVPTHPLAGLPEGDGALQTRTNGTRTPAPDQNFEGMTNACGCYPPDTNGAAGQNHYVQVVNAQFAAWTKTGTQVVPPTTINTLFPGTPHCASLNRGDPVVVYDQFAQRFVISPVRVQRLGRDASVLGVHRGLGDERSDGHLVRIRVRSAARRSSTTTRRSGVWPSQNSYTMTANQFLLGATYAGVGIWAFERDSDADDCQTARFVVSGHGGDRPVPAGDASGRRRRRHAASGGRACPVRLDQPGRVGPSARIRSRSRNATVDWSGTPSITVTHDTDVQAAPFDENLCDFGACIPQPGTTVKLQTLSDRVDVARAVPQLRRLADARHEPFGRRRQRPCGRALVPASRRSGHGRLGNARPGDVRAG